MTKYHMPFHYFYEIALEVIKINITSIPRNIVLFKFILASYLSLHLNEGKMYFPVTGFSCNFINLELNNIMV